MVELHLCGYCLALPENDRARAARVLRCPLCKAELGCTSEGGHFRLRAGAPAPSLPWRSPVLWLGAAIGISVTLLLIFLARSLFPAPPAVATAAVRAPAVMSAEPAAPELELLAIARGPGRFALLAKAHPSATRPWCEAKESPTPEPRAIARTAPTVPQLKLALTGPSMAAKGPPVNYIADAVRRTAGELRPLSDTMMDAVQQTVLLQVPEVALQPKPVTPPARGEAKKRIAALAAEIQRVNGKHADSFVRKLMQERTDLAGLPFRLGGDCQLGTADANNLASSSLSVRNLLATLQEQERRYGYLPDVSASLPNPAVRGLSATRDTQKLALLPGLMQVLAPEAPKLRRDLIVEPFRTVDSPAASAALEKLTVFDPDAEVRRAATEALRQRGSEKYGAAFVQAFRYPWPEAARRAAEALVALKRSDLAPKLVDFLDEPNPAAPYESAADGKKEWRVRELVRINHHRNCLLCHVPIARVDRNEAAGVVPSPEDPLPASASRVYYNSRPGDTVVRASVTYLRQDFSLLQPVDDAKPWPETQRFDFLVRTRTLDAAEARELQQARPSVSPQHEAAVAALQALTGQDHGPRAAAWRRALGR